MMTTKDKLISAVTQYDRKQSSKRGYNFYALPQYMARVDLICNDIAAGAGESDAIKAGFDGRLADACLRALGLPITTDLDSRGRN